MGAWPVVTGYPGDSQALGSHLTPAPPRRLGRSSWGRWSEVDPASELTPDQLPLHPRDFIPAYFLPWHPDCPLEHFQCPPEMRLGSDPRASGAKVRIRKGLKVSLGRATSDQPTEGGGSWVWRGLDLGV